jgi:polyisoprenoid-binding protein YceI
MSKRTLIAAVVAGLLTLGGAAGVGVAYLVVFAGSSPQKLALSSPTPTISSSSTASASAGIGAGSWTVASGSVAGYRVREQLASLSAPSDAVGRTSSISGSVTISQSGTTYTVAAASITVNVNTLTSDRSMRDQRIHRMGLESDRYPTATFVLTTPMTLPAEATSGQAVNVSATGQLTIHGVTQTVTIPMQARLNGTQVEIAGSITFPFSQFDMTPPSIGGFVTVQNNATMEFDLKFVKQGA